MSLFGNTFYARGVFGVMISFLFVCTFVVVIFLVSNNDKHSSQLRNNHSRGRVSSV